MNRLAGAALQWLAWWSLLFWLWLAYVGEWDRYEWIAGAGAAAVAATGAAVVHALGLLRFRPVLSELARADRVVLLEADGVLPRRDVHVPEPDLAPVDLGVAVGEVRPAGPDRLDLRAGEGDAAARIHKAVSGAASLSGTTSELGDAVAERL